MVTEVGMNNTLGNRGIKTAFLSGNYDDRGAAGANRIIISDGEPERGRSLDL